jgi:uncharacterized membrane protein YdbT with pleckstrin-like domain
MSEEKVLFKGSPSQVLNLGVFLTCAALAVADLTAAILTAQAWVLALLLAPLAWAGWAWLQVRSRVYEITSERIRVSTGILTRRTDDLELYRVEDLTLVEPLGLRLFGLGIIELATNDTSNPSLLLPALPGAKRLREELRQAVEDRREKKRVRVTEMESGPSGGP